MLHKEEQLRLASIIDVAKEDIKDGTNTLTPQTTLWVALKLQEIHAAYKARFEEGKAHNRHSQVVIEQAKEILMNKYGLPEKQAHSFLLKVAMDHQMTKFKAAQRVIHAETGE